MINPTPSARLFAHCLILSCGFAAWFVSDFDSRAAVMIQTEGSRTVMRTAERLEPTEHGVGELVADFDLRTIDGREGRLRELASHGPVVIFMTSSSCPLSLKYQPTIESLLTEYAPRSVKFVVVASVSTDTPEEIQDISDRLGEAAWVIRDENGEIARLLGARSTTDSFVVDSSLTVLYHGAIDDQYGIGVALEEPKNRWLTLALENILKGRRPIVEATFAPGCLLDSASPTETTATQVTYYEHVSRIMQRNCVSCHREEGAGPFPLDSFEEVVAHAPMIKQVVEQGIMPPWFASHDEASVSPWANDRRLSPREKTQLLAWIDSERLAGDPQQAPAAVEYAGSWSIGEPDVVYSFEEPVAVRATGVMPYRNVRVETHLSEDRWVDAIEVMPGVREVVHHVLVFVETPSPSRRRGQGIRARLENDETGGFWAAYVPGNSTLIYPHGYAKRLPKDAVLRFQMHYTPMGRAVEDTTSIGIRFASGPPDHEVKVHGLANLAIEIPAGAARHREEASLRLPMDVQVLAFMPHMHLRGAACKYEHVRGSEVNTLLDIPRYDFNWQLLYRRAEPIEMRAGETLRFVAWYDNSEANPANPAPEKIVKWGPQTDEEMLLGYVEYIEVNDNSSASNSVDSTPNNLRLAQGQQALLRRAFGQLDEDGNGRLTRAEFQTAGERFPRLERFADRADQVFRAADSNGDGELDSEEFNVAGANLLSRIR